MVVDDIVVRRTGSDVYIRAFGSPIFGADGALTHVIVAFLDISKEAEAEAERRQMEERLRSRATTRRSPIWMTDADGVITMSEGAGLASLGVSRANSSARTCSTSTARTRRSLATSGAR